MSSSSGGGTDAVSPLPAAADPPSASLPGGGFEASRSRGGSTPPESCRHTVLMSVRVSVCHSGVRPLCLPGAAADESLCLQLSMDPGRPGEFRLSLRGGSGTGRSVVGGGRRPLRAAEGV